MKIVNTFIAIIFLTSTHHPHRLASALDSSTVSNSNQIEVRKCCPFGQALVIENGAIDCVNYTSEISWRGFYYDKHSFKRLALKEEAELNPIPVIPLLDCDYNLLPAKSEDKASIGFKLLNDGKVVLHCPSCPSCKKWISVKTEFCIDGLATINPDGSANFTGTESEQLIAICPHNNGSAVIPNKTIPKLYAGIFLTSSVLYLCTAIVYILLWDTHNIQGWTVFGLITSRFLMCILLGVAYLFDVNDFQNRNKSFICIAIGVMAHFFMLLSFTWLMILCFDMWWTFRSIRPRTSKSASMKAFVYYVVIAGGIPLIVVTVSVTLNQIFSGQDGVIIPDYGNGSCFLSSCSKGPYIFYVVGVCISASFVFSALTFYHIYQYRKESAKIAKSSEDVKGYVLYTKLFLLMGITWIFEFISWAVASEGENDDKKTWDWIWISINIFNLLITSKLIFIILVCKRQILERLKKKYTWVMDSSNKISTTWEELRNTVRGQRQSPRTALLEGKPTFVAYSREESSQTSLE